eukprot:CAMPEP_0172395850 /NCGR_PEP_ID=MMETSP1061-20121228/22096_1 /TAXON_ID=37318 /ORGANISM="Pseudo-nitzschia pungens, Strain cf. pungens" /LENGTH=815 /DNA_ID=CAMNT_0013127553 /DNA_START=67 /DNA_END=2514 /DNA_ORIENTATION=+
MRFDRLALKALALLALSHAPLPFQSTSSTSMTSMVVAAEDAPVANVAVPENAESFTYEAEVSRMLDIVVNSLYQNKDVFLRELISNASDALDKIRFLSLTNPDYMKGEEKLQVQIECDFEANTLTVRDTGIGMTHDELVANLGTVARSGTTKFLQALKAEGSDGTETGDISQIGQFGVGFYSAFLVADRIQVASKHYDSSTQYVWSSTNGSSEFNVYEDPRGTTLPRGTEITLFLKEDCLEYSDEGKLSELAKHYSEFVTHPISLRTRTIMDVEIEDDEAEDAAADEAKTEDGDLEVEVEEDDEATEKPKKTKQVTTFDWELLNGNPAIWTRSKEDITDDEYQSFYKVLTKDEIREAESWTHFNAEGNINFKSILYLPKDAPQEMFDGIKAHDAYGLSLYVKKVLISDTFDMLPRYLYFMKGVVDSDDLPLNVNRETLQESRIIQIIKKKVVRKALEMLKNFKKEAEDEAAAVAAESDEGEEDEEDEEIKTPPRNKYTEWYLQFAPQIKMGVIEDEPNRSKLMKLLLYKSSTSDGEVRTLEKYVENMKDWQKEIYYVAGDGIENVKKSQFLEPFNEKGVEVLYFVDPVDEYMVNHARSFDGKNFKNIATDNIKLQDSEEDKDLATRREKFYKEKFKPLTTWLKSLYGTSIMNVKVSNREMSAPAIVSSAEYGHSANMERIMRAQAYSNGQTEFAMRSMKIFEINPRHPMIIKLLESAPPKDADKEFEVSKEAKDAAMFLQEMALLNGGYPIENPQGHSRRILTFLQSQLELESLKLEAHAELPVEEDVPPELDLDDIPIDMDEFMDASSDGSDEL